MTQPLPSIGLADVSVREKFGARMDTMYAAWNVWRADIVREMAASVDAIGAEVDEDLAELGNGPLQRRVSNVVRSRHGGRRNKASGVQNGNGTPAHWRRTVEGNQTLFRRHRRDRVGGGTESRIRKPSGGAGAPSCGGSIPWGLGWRRRYLE